MLCCSTQVDKKKESALRCSYYNRANSFPHLSFLYFFHFFLVSLFKERKGAEKHTQNKKSYYPDDESNEINFQSTLLVQFCFNVRELEIEENYN